MLKLSDLRLALGLPKKTEDNPSGLLYHGDGTQFVSLLGVLLYLLLRIQERTCLKILLRHGAQSRLGRRLTRTPSWRVQVRRAIVTAVQQGKVFFKI